ncbi:MAG: SDR family NAD(P)-dependent oxidoreductase [Labrys sp. (in: a-proteobacteria)]
MRHVLITGASSGIGRALALSYAAPEVMLTLAGRDKARLDDVATRCRAAGAVVATLAIDVQDRAAMAAALAAVDGRAPLALAIACAGITSGTGSDHPFEDPEAVRGVLGVNIFGVLNTLDPLIAPMTRRRSGHLAIVTSLAALRGLPSSPAYSAAKAAILAYGEGLRPTLARHGVTLSLVAPGFVETPLNAAIHAPRPLQIDAATAARRIRRGLDRRRPLIAFPFPLYLGLRLLGLLPAALGDRILDRPGIEVPQTSERWRG